MPKCEQIKFDKDVANARPAQGTTLRAIMDWSARHQRGVKCQRKMRCEGYVCDVGSVNNLVGVIHAYDLFEADDWQASIDGGKTWFVPGQVEPLEGPELWAWMCHTNRPVVSVPAQGRLGGTELVVTTEGDIWVRDLQNDWKPCTCLPKAPCLPRSGSWDDA